MYWNWIQIGKSSLKENKTVHLFFSFCGELFLTDLNKQNVSHNMAVLLPDNQFNSTFLVQNNKYINMKLWHWKICYLWNHTWVTLKNICKGNHSEICFLGHWKHTDTTFFWEKYQCYFNISFVPGTVSVIAMIFQCHNCT